MIQRIQSIYLFLAALTMLVLPWFFPLFVVESGRINLIDDPIFFGAFYFSGVLSLFTIFRYKNRQQQVVSGRINVLLNFIVFGFLMYYFYSNLNAANTSVGTTAFLPLLTVIFVSLANRAIIKDEALVKAADRFR